MDAFLDFDADGAFDDAEFESFFGPSGFGSSDEGKSPAIAPPPAAVSSSEAATASASSSDAAFSPAVPDASTVNALQDSDNAVPDTLPLLVHALKDAPDGNSASSITDAPGHPRHRVVFLVDTSAALAPSYAFLRDAYLVPIVAAFAGPDAQLDTIAPTVPLAADSSAKGAATSLLADPALAYMTSHTPPSDPLHFIVATAKLGEDVVVPAPPAPPSGKKDEAAVFGIVFFSALAARPPTTVSSTLNPADAVATLKTPPFAKDPSPGAFGEGLVAAAELFAQLDETHPHDDAKRHLVLVTNSAIDLTSLVLFNADPAFDNARVHDVVAALEKRHVNFSVVLPRHGLTSVEDLFGAFKRRVSVDKGKLGGVEESNIINVDGDDDIQDAAISDAHFVRIRGFRITAQLPVSSFRAGASANDAAIKAAAAAKPSPPNEDSLPTLIDLTPPSSASFPPAPSTIPASTTTSAATVVPTAPTPPTTVSSSSTASKLPAASPPSQQQSRAFSTSSSLSTSSVSAPLNYQQNGIGGPDALPPSGKVGRPLDSTSSQQPSAKRAKTSSAADLGEERGAVSVTSPPVPAPNNTTAPTAVPSPASTSSASPSTQPLSILTSPTLMQQQQQQQAQKQAELMRKQQPQQQQQLKRASASAPAATPASSTPSGPSPFNTLAPTLPKKGAVPVNTTLWQGTIAMAQDPKRCFDSSMTLLLRKQSSSLHHFEDIAPHMWPATMYLARAVNLNVAELRELTEQIPTVKILPPAGGSPMGKTVYDFIMNSLKTTATHGAPKGMIISFGPPHGTKHWNPEQGILILQNKDNLLGMLFIKVPLSRGCAPNAPSPSVTAVSQAPPSGPGVSAAASMSLAAAAAAAAAASNSTPKMQHAKPTPKQTQQSLAAAVAAASASPALTTITSAPAGMNNVVAQQQALQLAMLQQQQQQQKQKQQQLAAAAAAQRNAAMMGVMNPAMAAALNMGAGAGHPQLHHAHLNPAQQQQQAGAHAHLMNLGMLQNAQNMGLGMNAAAAAAGLGLQNPQQQLAMLAAAQAQAQAHGMRGLGLQNMNMLQNAQLQNFLAQQQQQQQQQQQLNNVQLQQLAQAQGWSAQDLMRFMSAQR